MCVYDDLTLAHAARRTVDRLVADVVALPAIEFDPVNLIAGDADGAPAAARALLELDLPAVQAKELALQAPAVVQHERIGVDEHAGRDENQTRERKAQFHDVPLGRLSEERVQVVSPSADTLIALL